MKSFIIISTLILFISSHICSAESSQQTGKVQLSNDFEINLENTFFNKNFDAKGDSITDDTEAIQNAVESGNGNIIFSPGVYRITKTINIFLDEIGPVTISGQGTAKIIMDGPGPAFKLIGTHEGSADPPTVKPNIWKRERMPLIDGLEIIGKHPEAVGIEATGTMQLTITRSLIRETLHGIHLTKRNRNVIISDCHLYNNRGAGIFLDEVNLHQINIVGCHISYNAGGGIVVNNGDIHNLQVGTCDIEFNMSRNGPPAANILIDMTKDDSDMFEVAIVGNTIQHDYNAPGSSNLRFIGRGTEERRKIGNISISGNNLSETCDNIHLKYCRGVIITGNTFYMGMDHNILIEDCDHIQINSNLLDRNTHYGPRSMRTNDGIVVRNSNYISINDLHIHHVIGSPAIQLEHCQSYNLMNCTILNCEEGGILLHESSNGKISGNFINEDRSEVINPIAIRVQGGKNNLITNNFTNGNIEGKSDVAKIVNNFSFKNQ